MCRKKKKNKNSTLTAGKRKSVQGEEKRTTTNPRACCVHGPKRSCAVSLRLMTPTPPSFKIFAAFITCTTPYYNTLLPFFFDFLHCVVACCLRCSCGWEISLPPRNEKENKRQSTDVEIDKKKRKKTPDISSLYERPTFVEEEKPRKAKVDGQLYRKSPSAQQATATSRRNGLTSIAARPRRPPNCRNENRQ